QSVVGDIQVRGNQRITEKLVRRELEVVPGQPLDLSALAKSRRNLYDTGAFSVVNINQVDRERRENREADAAGGPQTAEGPQTTEGTQTSDQAAKADDNPPNGQKPVPLNVVVREVQ